MDYAIKLLLNGGIALNYSKTSDLIRLIHIGLYDSIKSVIRIDGNPDFIDENGRNAIMHGFYGVCICYKPVCECYQKRQKILTYLLTTSINIHHMDYQNHSILWHAVNTANLYFVKVLLKYGIRDSYNSDLLILAADKKCGCKNDNHINCKLYIILKDIIKLLIENNIVLSLSSHINTIDVNGNNILYYAIKNKNIILVKYLINIGINLNHVNYKNRDISYYANKYNNEILIRLFNDLNSISKKQRIM
jgi:ankyrin repeat protein